MRSRLSAGRAFAYWGDCGAFVKYGIDVQKEALWAARTPHDPAWAVEPEESWGQIAIDGDRRRLPTARGSYGAFYDLSRRACGNDVPPPVDPEDGVAALEILEVAHG